MSHPIENENGAEVSQARRPLRSVLLFLLALNVGFGLALWLVAPKAERSDIPVAEEFMTSIEMGHTALEGEETTGYEVAFDALLPSVRETLPFADFLSFFDEHVREYGFIQAWRRLVRERGHIGNRKLRFEFEYGGIDEAPTFVIYEITMKEEGGSYGVASYSLISKSQKSD